MTGYDITFKTIPNESKEDLVLQPIVPDDGTGNDREKEFLHEIIQRINALFGNIAPVNDQKFFTAQIAQKAQENNLVVEQINQSQNTKEQAMAGDLPKVVTQSVMQAMASHDAIARALLKDQQIMKDFVGIVYDLVKSGRGNEMLGPNKN